MRFVSTIQDWQQCIEVCRVVAVTGLGSARQAFDPRCRLSAAYGSMTQPKRHCSAWSNQAPLPPSSSAAEQVKDEPRGGAGRPLPAIDPRTWWRS